MATDIFQTNPGMVAAIDGPGVPMSLFLEGWGGFTGFKSIITDMKVHATGGVQFLHTLRDFIYIYVFGDRITDMQISGLSFWQTCPGNSGAHGIEYVNGYYLQNRVSERDTPVVIVIGLQTGFYGFLTSFQFDYNDPESQIAQFTLGFKVIPEASNLG